MLLQMVQIANGVDNLPLTVIVIESAWLKVTNEVFVQFHAVRAAQVFIPSTCWNVRQIWSIKCDIQGLQLGQCVKQEDVPLSEIVT